MRTVIHPILVFRCQTRLLWGIRSHQACMIGNPVSCIGYRQLKSDQSCRLWLPMRLRIVNDVSTDMPSHQLDYNSLCQCFNLRRSHCLNLFKTYSELQLRPFIGLSWIRRKLTLLAVPHPQQLVRHGMQLHDGGCWVSLSSRFTQFNKQCVAVDDDVWGEDWWCPCSFHIFIRNHL